MHITPEKTAGEWFVDAFCTVVGLKNQKHVRNRGRAPRAAEVPVPRSGEAARDDPENGDRHPAARSSGKSELGAGREPVPVFLHRVQCDQKLLQNMSTLRSQRPASLAMSCTVAPPGLQIRDDREVEGFPEVGHTEARPSREPAIGKRLAIRRSAPRLRRRS